MRCLSSFVHCVICSVGRKCLGENSFLWIYSWRGGGAENILGGVTKGVVKDLWSTNRYKQYLWYWWCYFNAGSSNNYVSNSFKFSLPMFESTSAFGMPLCFSGDYACEWVSRPTSLTTIQCISPFILSATRWPSILGSLVSWSQRSVSLPLPLGWVLWK